MEDKAGKELGEKLTKLLKMSEKQEDIMLRAAKDPNVLKDLGFTPEEISTFKIHKMSRDSCDCTCWPSKGTGVGCAPGTTGSSTDP